MPVKRENEIYRTFVISTSLVIALTVAGVFYYMAQQTRELTLEQNLLQARVLYNNIIMTRRWNAHYGGVYVEKRGDVESNPYLVNPDVRTADGRIFTKRNPALMIREISEIAAQQGVFKFHITSLKLLNPNNKPDEFEKNALQQFEKNGVHEVYRTEAIKNREYFRYIAPLYVEKDCLECHAKQGYSVGDVRGGISVSFDIGDLQSMLKVKTRAIIGFGITTAIVLLGLVYFFLARLIQKLAEARRTIEKIAITDELTTLYNRRYVLSRFNEEFEKSRRLGKGLSCIMADIDHFKNVNDTLGHLVGDEVLLEVSRRIKEAVRVYDILGRYGGEEFLILLPDTNPEQAWNFAERTRMQVSANTIRDLRVTVSMGVTCLHESDQSIDDMIKRADEALYKAKNAGRDRVDWVWGA